MPPIPFLLNALSPLARLLVNTLTSFCPSVFEHDVNPVIHRPYIGHQSPKPSPAIGTVTRHASQTDNIEGISNDDSDQLLKVSTTKTTSSPNTLPARASSAPAGSSNTLPSHPEAPNHGSSIPSPSLYRPPHPQRSGLSRTGVPRSQSLTAFPCKSCNEKFQRRCDLKIHEKRFKCRHHGCTQKPFGFDADLRRHILAKHNVATGKATFKCKVDGCNEVFSRKDNMRRHARKKHLGVHGEAYNVYSTTVWSDKRRSISGLVACPTVLATPLYKISSDVHAPTPYVFGFCSDSLYTSEKEQQFREQHTVCVSQHDVELDLDPNFHRPYLSPLGTSTSTASSDSSSSRSPQALLLECTECKDTFKRFCDLNRHMVSIHIRPFKCPELGCQQRPFGLKADLKRHMSTVHCMKSSSSGIKCSFDGCSRKFSRQDNMRRHAKIHSKPATSID
ncbi:hypothetical protein DE146DRAFT_781025 [Phaeosphaeria sp. MPI-PUGE-AT-0046c]|nr:hypothetical protein DE146DRAFT_781025 [Phaeosphaeria sp. MPI-PUGE-AT-0046c]